MIPKQIIYPIDYSKLLGTSDQAAAENFQANFSHYIAPSSFYLPLGRARAGIYLFVKRFVDNGRKKVILSPYTIPDVINMVIFAGGLPVFVDALPNSTNVDTNQLAELIDDQTACVMITHYHVNQNEYRNIVSLCRQRDVKLFEDCAISLGGQIDGETVGLGSAGGVFSLSSFKFLNFIWGGVLFTRQQPLYHSCKDEVSQWPRLRRRDYIPALVRTAIYDFSTRPWVYRLLTAPLLRYQQRQLDQPVMTKSVRIESSSLDRTLTTQPHGVAFAEWNHKFEGVQSYLSHRRAIASVYAQNFADRMVAKETAPAVIASSCFVNYPIVVPAARRNVIYKRLLLAGYDVGLSLYPNVHEHPSFKGYAGYSNHIGQLVRSVITLPTHPLVTVAYAESLTHQLLALL
ncbi:MAG: DegT/DnrJ/EryC1/StrS family aminotransferase [Gloeobacterales cyanobacterium]